MCYISEVHKNNQRQMFTSLKHLLWKFDHVWNNHCRFGSGRSFRTQVRKSDQKTTELWLRLRPTPTFGLQQLFDATLGAALSLQKSFEERVEPRSFESQVRECSDGICGPIGIHVSVDRKVLFRIRIKIVLDKHNEAYREVAWTRLRRNKGLLSCFLIIAWKNSEQI